MDFRCGVQWIAVKIRREPRSETSTVDNGWSNVGLFGVFDGHGGFQVRCWKCLGSDRSDRDIQRDALSNVSILDLLWWLFFLVVACSRWPNSVNVAASACLLEMATLIFQQLVVRFLSSAMPDFRSLTWSHRIQAWFEDVKCEMFERMESSNKKIYNIINISVFFRFFSVFCVKAKLQHRRVLRGSGKKTHAMLTTRPGRCYVWSSWGARR